jgi:hypothetical protein
MVVSTFLSISTTDEIVLALPGYSLAFFEYVSYIFPTQLEPLTMLRIPLSVLLGLITYTCTSAP